jgi:hypothetical protein
MAQRVTGLRGTGVWASFVLGASSAAAVACGGDATSPNSGVPMPASPAQAAVALHITGGCGLPEGWFNIPAGDQPITANSIERRVIDGENGARVHCPYRGSSEWVSFVTPMVVDGPRWVGLPDRQLQLAPGQSNVDAVITLRPRENDEAREAHCKVSVAPPPLDLSAGRIWASVTCTVVPPGGGLTCDIAEGYFALEDCPQGR